MVTELVASSQAQGYSLRGLATGVYILDVLVDSPTSSNKNAYETILVILGPNQPPIQNITEITKIINSVSVKIKIVNKFDNDNKKPNPGNESKSPEKCKKYEELIDGKCEPIDCLDVEGPGGCSCLINNECDDPNPLPPIECQPEDDFCEPGCESPTVDCIDDVNIGDDGEPVNCPPGQSDNGSGCEEVREEEEEEQDDQEEQQEEENTDEEEDSDEEDEEED